MATEETKQAAEQQPKTEEPKTTATGAQAQEEKAAACEEQQSAPADAESAKSEKEQKHHAPEKEGGTKLAADLAAAKAKLEAMEKQLAEGKDSMLRTMAEYDNFRKRSAKEHDAAFNSGVEFAVAKLLPVLDTLTLAAGTQTADESYKKGVMMTLNKAEEAFDAMGVKEIEAEGKAFDPALHAAVLQQPAAEGTESGTIVQVLQKGYELNGKVIRHASVAVAE